MPLRPLNKYCYYYYYYRYYGIVIIVVVIIITIIITTMSGAAVVYRYIYNGIYMYILCVYMCLLHAGPGAARRAAAACQPGGQTKARK